MHGAKDTKPPPRLSVATLRLGADELLVLSHPFEPVDLRASSQLSEAETAVVSLLVEGRTNAEIAAARGTAVRTVANQVASILRKLGLGSRREVAALYVRGAL